METVPHHYQPSVLFALKVSLSTMAF